MIVIVLTIERNPTHGGLLVSVIDGDGTYSKTGCPPDFEKASDIALEAVGRFLEANAPNPTLGIVKRGGHKYANISGAKKL